MEKVIIKEIHNKKEWDNFLKSHQEANFLQSWQWGEFHKKLKKKVNCIGFYKSGKLEGVMLSVVEQAKRATYMTVPGGPIINWKDKKLVAAFKNEVMRLAKENRCSFVRVRPQLELNDFSKRIFKQLGFRPSPMHLHAELTNELTITKPESELLANMKKGTRYEIRKAEKIGIRIEESHDAQKIKTFYNLQLETAKRHGFVPFSLQYLQEQFKVFAKEKQVILYSAYFKKKLLAQAFIIFYGSEGVYHYGASTDLARTYPGAYLIQWKAILEAKKRGMKTYNFWGVAGEGHRFANLSLFKRGFGGQDKEYLHAQDLVIQQFPYMVNFFIEMFRKKIRHV